MTAGFREVLAELARWERVSSIRLEGLTESETGELIRALGDAEGDAGYVTAVLLRSGGNPYLIEELVAAGDGRLPGPLAEIVLTRVRRLTAPAQGVVRAAAVIGQRVPDRLLSSVTAVRSAQFVDLLHEVLDAGVLVSDHADGTSSGTGWYRRRCSPVSCRRKAGRCTRNWRGRSSGSTRPRTSAIWSSWPSTGTSPGSRSGRCLPPWRRAGRRWASGPAWRPGGSSPARWNCTPGCGRTRTATRLTAGRCSSRPSTAPTWQDSSSQG